MRLYGVNPAFTSFFGRIKYMKLYGLSVHNAAAVVIGRRGIGYNETISENKVSISIKTDNGPSITIESPGRMANMKKWAYYGILYKMYKATLQKNLPIYNRPKWLSLMGNM